MNRLLDFISRWALPFGREWFRLMGWLLIIGALGAAERITESEAVRNLRGFSIAVLWLYVVFGYSEALTNYMRLLARDEKLPRRRMFVIGSGALVLLTVIWWIAAIITDVAVEFADKLSGL